MIRVDETRWGRKGHALVHREALNTLPADMPDFFRSGADGIVSLASLPDRWKSEEFSHLRTNSIPDHYLNCEFLGDRPLPADQFEMAVLADKSGLKTVQAGLLPYAVGELVDALTADFAFWRLQVSHGTGDTPAAHQLEETALYHAAVLGHFVGDASQPMHATMHYDGWNPIVPNPNGYRTTRGLHRQFESLLVNAAVDEQRVHDQIGPVEPVPGDAQEWGLQLARESNSHIEELYQLEKDGHLDPEHPDPEGVRFAEARLARGAENLRDIWYSAWVKSEAVAEKLEHSGPELDDD